MIPSTNTFGAPGASAAETVAEYRLGPQDKVGIKVYEWRPARDEIYEWSAFKAEHTVDSAGKLSLPLLGTLSAGGLTTSELARLIGERLQERMGLTEIPDITIELVQHRPFYVVGAVDKPGEYPYRPGLTVLKAFVIAGGKPRNSTGLMRFEREAITTRGELNSMYLEEAGLRMRIARLHSELDGAQRIIWPDELKAQIFAPHIKHIAVQEKLVFETRKRAFQTQLDALEQLHSYLSAEVQSLEKQAELQKVELKTVEEETDLVSQLHEKGLAVTSRKLAVTRNLAQVKGDRLRLEASLLRAHQEVSKTKISIIDLKAKRSSEISAELQKSQARLDEIKTRSNTAKSLLYETENIAPQLLDAQKRALDQKPMYKIIRNGHTLEGNSVTEESPIEPGDTIVVQSPERLPPRQSWSETDTANATDSLASEPVR